MEAKQEFGLFMAIVIASAIGLIVVHKLYLSHLDVSFHAELDGAGAHKGVQDLREVERAALASGKMSIADAKAKLAKDGRGGFPVIAPKPSDDVSAMSGWIQRKGFKPWQAPAQPPAAPVVAPENAEPNEESQAAEGSTDQPAAQPVAAEQANNEHEAAAQAPSAE